MANENPNQNRTATSATRLPTAAELNQTPQNLALNPYYLIRPVSSFEVPPPRPPDISAVDVLNTGTRFYSTSAGTLPVQGLEDFASQTGPSGFQRPSRFCVFFDSLPLPASDNQRVEITEAERLLLSGVACSSITTPARAFETTELSIFGYDETYPTGTEYTSITCMFLLPLSDNGARASNLIYKFFVDWQNKIQNVTTDGYRTFQFPNTYRLTQGFIVETYSNLRRNRFVDRPTVTDPIMAVQNQVSQNPFSSLGRFEPNPNDARGQITSRTRYYNVYPKTIVPSNLDWNATDEFLQLSIEFSYTHWEDVS